MIRGEDGKVIKKCWLQIEAIYALPAGMRPAYAKTVRVGNTKLIIFPARFDNLFTILCLCICFVQQFILFIRLYI